MTRALVAGVTVLALGAVVGPAGAQTGPLGTTVSSSDTVHVAPPTGHKDADRASIPAALERVQPGGSILFAPGTYLIGEMIRVSVPGITLPGHRQGTTLRGCDPSEEAERHAANSCQGLELTGGRQIVRNLTFEHAHFDLVVGCCIDALRTGQPLHFDRIVGQIRALRPADERISLQLPGRVHGMRTGAGSTDRSLMPTVLEWLHARHGASLLWGSSLYLFGLVVGVARSWSGRS